MIQETRRCATAGAVALACAALLAACGGGGGDDASGGSASPQVQQARALAAPTVTRQAGIGPVVTPFGDEAWLLYTVDLNLDLATAPALLPGRYAQTLQRLRTRTGITGDDTRVVSDLACTAMPFGGGIAGDRVIVLDGKLLDVMAEVANGIALRESGRLAATDAQIVDAAAAAQLGFAFFCRAADPIAFPDAVLDSREFERAVEIFAQLAGGIYFHEFGHVWGWHALLRLRDQAFVQGRVFGYSSAIEDNADLTAGILSAKAGHDARWPRMMFDLMSFTFMYRRQPGWVGYADVQTWAAQFQQLSPTYSPLAQRKQWVDLGYAAWQQR